jgi:hypothetical protein
MSSPPAFQFYARDWLSGTKCRMLTPATRAAYIDLLCLQWLDGRIPDSDDLPAWLNLNGYDPDELDMPRLLALFPDGQNARLEKERRKQAEYRKKKADAGRKGAKRRWQPDSSANGSAMANGIANDGPSSASASSPAGTPSSVLSEPATPSVEKSESWNARLAPRARTFGGEKNISDLLRWCRDTCSSFDQAERVLIGGDYMRESGQLSGWVEPGEPMGVATLLSSMGKGMPFSRQAENAYWLLQKRKGPKKPDMPGRLSVTVNAAAAS